MKIRSLFLKIFVWFWLAAAAIIGVVTLATRVSDNESLPDRIAHGTYGEALSLYAESAVHVFVNDGAEAFEQYVRRSQAESGTEIFLFDVQGNPLTSSNPDDAAAMSTFVRKIAVSQQPFTRPSKYILGRDAWGRSVVASNGRRYIFVALFHQPPMRPAAINPWSPTRVISNILMAGLVCYLLALYLTQPLKKLKHTVQAFAEGNFDVRVSPGLGSREDELADLGREFDHMAERIATLITSQKRLMADISHELRSPLARLSVALELARKNSGEKASAALSRIETEAERLNLLVGQLLALTRLESGSERIPPEVIAFEDLVQRVVSDADFEARPLHKEVRAVHLEACRVKGSAELLRSAVENVVRNAVRYTPVGTAVEVALSWKLDTAVLTVIDFGHGVPEGELKHIFEPFYRVSEARDRSSGGAGLGLSIADRTVKLHGGTIQAENARRGLLVTIRLPLAPNQSGAATQGDQAAFSPASLASG